MPINDRFNGIICAAIGVAMLVQTMTTRIPDLMGDPGPLLMPRIVGVVMVILGMALAIKGGAPVASSSEGGIIANIQKNRRALIIVIAVICYPVLFSTFGFFVSTAAFLFVATVMLHSGPFLKNLPVAIGFSLIVPIIVGAVMRRWLDVPLPGTLL